MKYPLFLVFFYLLSNFTSLAQTIDPKAALKQIIDHTEQNSLYREKVDWDSLKLKIYALASNADSIPDLKPALDFMLEEIGDDHGRVFHNNKYLAFYSGELGAHVTDFNWDIYGKIQNGQNFPFTASTIEKNIGYIRIVGLPMGDNQKMSSDIQDALCEQINYGAKDWIIDLRYNGGGNMFPMVEGISIIIGNGNVGGTQGLTKDESSIWEIRDGNYYFDEQNVAIEKTCKINILPKIAVLTSNYTASSGEALAVILKNRPKSRFFGQPTMGKITTTDWKQIDQLTAMSISVSYYKDRNGNIYDKYIDVDEEIKFDPEAIIQEDDAIKKAVKWLKK